MIYKKLITSVLVVLLLAPVNFAFSQDDDKTEEERIAELKTNAKELLLETSSMALNLASPTNRVNFTIKSADILWKLEETDARAMFNASIADVKRMIAQLDFETNQQRNAQNTSWQPKRSSRNILNTRKNQVFLMRSSLVSALANHDPEWAMRFLQETSQMFTNPSLVSKNNRDNKRLEAQIIRKIADKDVSKALELGREKLSKGVSSEVVSLLNRIYGKDKEKGAEFAKDILQKLKTSTLKSSNTWLIINLFQYGLGTLNEENPLFDKSSMADLAELIAKQVTSSTSRQRKLSQTVMKGLEQYAPNSAAQVKRTFEQRNSARNVRSGNRDPISKTEYREKQREMSEERSKFQNEITTDLNSLDDENLSSQDRERIINSTKSKIMSIDNDQYRFNGLIGLANRVAGIGDIDSAAIILNEAETYINPDPKERADFTQNQTLANAYALVDTDRSFSVLENMAYKLNGVINGYIKFMEFSGNGTIVENSELIINSRSRQFTRYMNFSPQTVRNLAEGDFLRLKDLSDKFERTEIRVATRLQIARALLNATNAEQNKMSDEKMRGISSVTNMDSRLRQFEDEYRKIEEALAN